RKPVDMPPETGTLVRAAALYIAGKLEECEMLCRQTDPLRPSLLHAQALMALGRAREAAANRAFENAFADPWGLLAVSLGLSREGQRDESDRWRERAIKALETFVIDTRRTAKLLGAAEPPAVAEFDEVMIDPEDKALALAVLAERFPAKRAE